MNPTQLLFKLDNYNLPTHFSKEPEILVFSGDEALASLYLLSTRL